jgi:hypothetical protein
MDKYEAFSIQLDTVRLNGFCKTYLIKSVLDPVRKVNKDVALFKSHNASLKSQINKVQEKADQP